MKSKKRWKSVLLASALTCFMSVSAYAAVTPQSDYYEYINQQWLEKTQIPTGKSSISNFYILDEATEAQLMSLLHDYNANYKSIKSGTDLKKVTTFYRMAKDFEKRDALGFLPIKPYTNKVEKVKSVNEFNEVLVELAKDGLYGPISFYVYPDEKNNNINVLYIGTPNLGLAKEHLLGNDDYSKKLRKGYIKYITKLFTLNGDDEKVAKDKAQLVLNISTKEAKAILPKEKESERELFYNVKTWQEIKALAPNMPYAEVAKALDVKKANKIIVSEPKAIVEMNNLYNEDNLPALKAQMQALILQSNVNKLSKDGIKAATEFKKVATGVYDLRSDDKLAYRLTNYELGEMLGKFYVRNYFPASSKRDVLNLVKEIQEAYKKRLKTLDWMSEETKVQAREKINAMTVKIGYPDYWTDYDNLAIKSYEDGSNLVENSIAITRFEQAKNLEKINKAPDKNEWGMTPQTINAYYNPTFNEIVFPAAILQAPFYSQNASEEENLGAIGAVIGHEISHAFDVSGAQYDKDGNLHNWWQKADYEKFKEKVEKAAKFYSKFEVLPGYFVNGKISTGEVFGDLGGVTIAIAIAEDKNLDTKKVFASYAKVWRNKMTRDALIGRLIDEHPPGKYRVNGIVEQIAKFYQDYNVKPGDGMYVAPNERFSVW